jgi:hypothetical protein
LDWKILAHGPPFLAASLPNLYLRVARAQLEKYLPDNPSLDLFLFLFLSPSPQLSSFTIKVSLSHIPTPHTNSLSI